MQAEFGKFLPHLQPRYAQPTRSLRLVALGQLDGLFEQFRLEVGNHACVSVLNLAALGSGEQICDIRDVRLI